MPKILFWNVYSKNLTNFVCSIAKSENVDIVVLLENGDSIESTREALQKHVSNDFDYPETIMKDDEKFHCFSRNSMFNLSELQYEERLSVRKFQLGHHTTLLALVHGIDVLNNDPATRQSNAQEIATHLRAAQKIQSIEKVIFLGDFNINPFDSIMNLARGFNAMMTKASIKSGRRKNIGGKFDFYYNPMWNLFGDDPDTPSGTIYNTTNRGYYGWSMLDQVIIHYSIVNLFESVRILTKAGIDSLATKNGYPDSANASDHFPILVSFKEDNNERVLAK